MSSTTPHAWCAPPIRSTRVSTWFARWCASARRHGPFRGWCRGRRFARFSTAASTSPSRTYGSWRLRCCDTVCCSVSRRRRRERPPTRSSRRSSTASIPTPPSAERGPLRMTNRAAAAGIVAARALGLAPDVLALLDRMTLPSRRPVLGDAGQRRSRRTGGSVEFADFRAYVPGDDFRRVDWNAYARHERMIGRLNSADEDVILTLLIAWSASMAYGDPSKLRAATSLAGALGYVALSAYDRACVASFASTATMLTPRLRGRAATHRLWVALAGLQSSGSTDFSAIGRGATRTAPGSAV